MKSVTALQEEISSLADSFEHTKDPKIILLFLHEELGEVTRAFLKAEGHKEDNTRVTESYKQELGDVFFLLLRFAAITNTDLQKQLLYTVEKLKKRSSAFQED